MGAHLTYKDADGNYALPLLLHYRNADVLIDEVVDKQQQVGDMMWRPMAAQEDEEEKEMMSPADLAILMGHGSALVKLMEMGVMPTKESSSDPAFKFLQVHRLEHGIEYVKQAIRKYAADTVECVDSEELLKFAGLLLHVDDIDFRDEKGKTPLYIAVGNNAYIEIIRELLKRGADPNVLDDSETPMMVFPLMKRDGANVVKLLLEFNANINALVDATGQTIVEFAKDCTICPKASQMIIKKSKRSKN
jgi:hypothetical protein